MTKSDHDLSGFRKTYDLIAKEANFAKREDGRFIDVAVGLREECA